MIHKRKSPYRHIVRSHTRRHGRINVDGYMRGKGIPPRRYKKVVVKKGTILVLPKTKAGKKKLAEQRFNDEMYLYRLKNHIRYGALSPSEKAEALKLLRTLTREFRETGKAYLKLHTPEVQKRLEELEISVDSEQREAFEEYMRSLEHEAKEKAHVKKLMTDYEYSIKKAMRARSKKSILKWLRATGSIEHKLKKLGLSHLYYYPGIYTDRAKDYLSYIKRSKKQ